MIKTTSVFAAAMAAFALFFAPQKAECAQTVSVSEVSRDANGVPTTVTLSFANNGASANFLFAALGMSDMGEDPADWDRVILVRVVHPDTGTLVYTLPAGMGTNYFAIRFMLCDTLPEPQPATNFYAASGLMAAWDGIDNAGTGVHDSNAGVWTDLTGNGANFPVTSYIGTQLTGWTATSLQAKSCYKVPCAKSCKDYVTIEICAKHNKQYKCLFNSGDGLNKFVAVMTSTIQFYNLANKNYAIGSDNWFQAAAVHSPTVSAPSVFSRGAAASQTASDTWGKNNEGTCLGRGANSYQFNGEYYAIRLYDRALTAQEIKDHAAIDIARFIDRRVSADYNPLSVSDAVLVSDNFINVSGTPSNFAAGGLPAYGMTIDPSIGAHAFSAPAFTDVEGSETMRAYCIGWRLYDGDGVLLRASTNENETALSCTIDYTSGKRDLVWLWDVRDLVGVGAPTVVANGGNSLALLADVTGIGYTAPSATLKFVYGVSPDALVYTNIASASVTEIGAVQSTLTRLAPGVVYYVKAVLETNDAAHDKVESEVGCFQTAPLDDRLGDPGLVQAKYAAAWYTGDWDIAGASDANRVLGAWAAHCGSNFSGTIPWHSADGETTYSTWGDNTTWGYVGYMYFENKTYTFGGCMDDNVRLVIGGATVLTESGSTLKTADWTPPDGAGWYPIEIRVGNGTGGYGPYSGFYGLCWNTTGYKTKDTSANWKKFVDPGDGSLLRTPVALTITAIENIADGALASVSLAFDSADSARALCAAWGPAYGGSSPADWYATNLVATIATGATSASWTPPSDWGSDSNLVVRFYFDGDPVEWSNAILCRDYSAPSVTDVSADGTGGDTLVVSGTLASFPGADCTLIIYTGDSPTTLTNAWTGLVGGVRDVAGDFALSLFEPDTASPRYIAPGSTHYVAVEARSDGKVSRTAPVRVTMESAPATFAATPTAAVNRRVLTFTGRFSALGVCNATDVSVWYGTANTPDDFVQVGESLAVSDTGTFSIVAELPAVNTTYWWQMRAVNESLGGTYCVTGRSAVVSSATKDTTTYTWKAKNGNWNGDWSDPGHWNAPEDSLGFPQTAAATAIFPIGQTIEVTLDTAVTVGTLNLASNDMADAASVLDLTFKGAAGENGGTNRVLTVSSNFSVRAPGGAFTLDNAALKIAYTATHEFINARLFRLQNGADFYANGNVCVYDGACLELEGQSTASVSAFYIGGGTATLVLDDSRLELRGESHFSSKSPGGTIIFRGAHPLLYVKNNSNTLYFNANNASAMVFEVPVGGFAEPVLQCTTSMAVNDLFRQNGKTTAKLTLSVPDDAPFYTQAGTLTQPLIAWFGSKAIATANLVFSNLPDGGSFVLGTAAAEDYGFVDVAEFSGTVKALGVRLVSTVHDGRLTVATDAPVPLDGYAPVLGVTDGLSGAVSLSAPTDVVSNGVHYVCTGYTLVEYAVGEAAEPTATNTVADGTSSFSYTMPAGRAEITWHYTADYPVTATAVNDAGGSVSLSSPYMADGSPVTLTASTVTDDMEFQYWYGDLPYAQRYQNPLILAADKAASVTAFFGATKENGGVRRAVWYDNRRNWYDTSVWSGGVIAGTNDTAVVVSTRTAGGSSNSKGWIVVPSFFAVGNLIVSNAMVQVATDTGSIRDSSADQAGFYYYWGSGTPASSNTSRREPVGFDVAGDVTIRRGNTTDVRNGGAIYVGGSQQRCFSQINIGGDLNIEHGGMQIAAGFPFDFYLDSSKKGVSGPSGAIAFPYEDELFRGSNFLKVGGNLTLAPTTSSVRNILQVANDFRTGAAVWLNVAGDVTVGAGSTVTAWRGGYGKFNGSGVADGKDYSMCPGGHGTSDNTSGGSHGGLGGSETQNPGYQKATTYVATYGYEFFPVHPGSPNAGNGGIDSRGGGSIRLDCVNLNLDGGLIANGPNGSGNKGGGAGGSILVLCDAVTFGDNCAVKADGGAPSGSNAGGGGGRIVLAEGLTPEQIGTLRATKAVPDGVLASPLGDTLGARGSAAALVATTDRSCGWDGTAWYLVNLGGRKTLTVAGDPDNLGAPTPPYGPQLYDQDDEVGITAPETAYITADNRTRRVCTGYVLTRTATGAVMAESAATSGTLTMDDDYTLTWKLTEIEHVVEIAAGVGGSIVTNAIGAADALWQPAGSTLSVTAVADSGWRFLGWMGDVAESAQHTATFGTTVAGTLSIRAVFVSDTAETATWTGEGDGADWLDAANWSTGKVPGPHTAVVVGAGASVTAAAGLVFPVSSLDVASGASLSILPEGSFSSRTCSQNPHTTPSVIALRDYHDCGLEVSGSITVAGALTVGRRDSAADARAVAGGAFTVAEGATVSVYGGFNDALIGSRSPDVWRNWGAIASVGGAMTVNGTLFLAGEFLSGSPVKVAADSLRIGPSGAVHSNSGGFGWRTIASFEICYAPGGMWGNNYTGGAYGGWGGGYNTPGDYGNKKTYGDPLRPFIAGSNGGHGGGDGRLGGGSLRIDVKGAIVNNGRISANGSSNYTGSGAGGSLWISCSRYRTGDNSVTTANGGTTGSGNGGCGGGGRVLVCERLTAAQIDALYATGAVPAGSIVVSEVTAENASDFVRGTISALGGVNTQTNPYFSGTDGTVRWLRGPEAGTMLIMR